MMSLGFLRLIVPQAKLALETGDFVTGLLVSGAVDFTGTDPTELLLVDEVTLPGGVPGAEYTAGVMEVETSACASFTFVGSAA